MTSPADGQQAFPADHPGRVIQVAVPRPLHAVYDYAVPDDQPIPAVGARVVVPFGNGTAIGICVNDEVTTAHPQLKAVTDCIDAQPLVTPEMMELAVWMTKYYHYPLGEVLATTLPVAARKGRDASLPPADIWAATGKEMSGRKAPRQEALLAHLLTHGPCPTEDLETAGFNRATLRALAEKQLAQQLSAAEVSALARVEPASPPQPTDEQRTAIDTITAADGSYQTFLLQGVTGSGKTEVYMQAMQNLLAAALRKDRPDGPAPQVLVLVPEIALTPQTLARFADRFANVGMMHSNLTDLGRFQTWLKCRDGHIQVLIGTRSAIFTPFKNLRLIIVDEEHDSSYKQQEGLRYSARDLAAKRAMDLQIPLILGSATPSLESLYNVEQGRYARLRLNQRATGASMPTYHLIDMRGQAARDGLSLPLQQVIRNHLEADAQVLVYLNRRGFAPTLLCNACGWIAHCDACDARLTLHTNPPHLRCHHCGHRTGVPAKCDECDNTSLLPVGQGTQRTEAAISNLFKDYPVYRIDRDSVRSNSELEARFAKINTGKPAIMVGTQMLAKGHHFPNVTLVAVINADAGFLSSDFRAPERTAQLIEQVAGRAGREARPGQVWIQTHQPDNPTLVRLIEEGYEAFAQLELQLRHQASLPPVTPMALLRADVLAEQTTAETNPGMDFLLQCKHVLSQSSELVCMGPIPAPLSRVAGRLRFQLMVIAPRRNILHRALHPLITARPPRGVRWSMDVDPYDTL